jgi:hypothetical protein
LLYIDGLQEVREMGVHEPPLELDAFLTTSNALPIADIIDATVGTRRTYQYANAEAERRRDRYQALIKLLLVFSLVGALASAVALLPERWPWVPPQKVISAAQFIALIATLLLLWWIKVTGSAIGWLNARSRAEKLRSRVFEEIVTAPLPAGGRAAVVQSAKLEALMRCYVRAQHVWLVGRGRRHAVAAKGQPLSRWLAIVLILVVTALAVPMVVGWLAAIGLSWPGLTALASVLDVPDADRLRLAMTTAIQGLLGFAAASSEVNQDRRKANLYNATAEKLDELIADDLAEVEADCAVGSDKALRRFFRSARTILEADHFAWKGLDPDAKSAAFRTDGGGTG